MIGYDWNAENPEPVVTREDRGEFAFTRVVAKPQIVAFWCGGRILTAAWIARAYQAGASTEVSLTAIGRGYEVAPEIEFVGGR